MKTYGLKGKGKGCGCPRETPGCCPVAGLEIIKGPKLLKAKLRRQTKKKARQQAKKDCKNF